MSVLGVYWKLADGDLYSSISEEQFHVTGVGQYLPCAEMSVNDYISVKLIKTTTVLIRIHAHSCWSNMVMQRCDC